eukprot:6073179-Pyramimonas_sp.AAC.1
MPRSGQLGLAAGGQFNSATLRTFSMGLPFGADWSVGFEARLLRPELSLTDARLDYFHGSCVSSSGAAFSLPQTASSTARRRRARSSSRAA